MRNVRENKIDNELHKGIFNHVEIKSLKVTIIYFKTMEIDRILIYNKL